MSELSNNIVEEYQNLLENAARNVASLLRQNAPVDTGALERSITWRVLQDNTIAIYYNRYGAYQDLGVQGWGTPPNYAPNSPFQFQNKPETGYNNMRKYGIPPQYWATYPNGEPRIPTNLITDLESGLVDAIENAVVVTTTQRNR